MLGQKLRSARCIGAGPPPTIAHGQAHLSMKQWRTSTAGVYWQMAPELPVLTHRWRCLLPAAKRPGLVKAQTMPLSMLLVAVITVPPVASSDEAHSALVYPSTPGVSILHIPYFEIRADDDDPSHVELQRDRLHGSGNGLRVFNLFRRNQVVDGAYDGLGAYRVALRERGTREPATGYALNYTMHLQAGDDRINDDLYLYSGVVLGLGIAKFDFSNQSANEWALSGELGFELGVLVARRVSVSIGGVYHTWGYPGETVGYGGYALAELRMFF